MKSEILVWLAISIVTTASKWAVSNRPWAILVSAFASGSIVLILTDPVSQISDRDIRTFIGDDLVRATLLGIVTMESICVGLFFWRTMRFGRDGMSGRVFGILSVIPSLGFVPMMLLTFHDVISRWNAIDYGLAAFSTGAVICGFALMTSILLRRTLRSDDSRMEYAALLTLLFLPWSGFALGWVRYSERGFGSTVPPAPGVDPPLWFWGFAFGLPALGVIMRCTFANLQERRLD
jgi:hypothetical protein